MNQLKVTILGFSSYSFEDQKTHKQVEGTTVWFVEEKPQNDDYGQGFLPKKVTLPYEYRHNLAGVKFPYSAEPKMGVRFTSKGAKTDVTEFELLNPVELVTKQLTQAKM